ncbi:MAG: hypothetical protein NWR41_03670 [Rickettsiaceae bacterium]|nr:hypothetical protein [Rickettsiaceae bacterium]
MARYLKKLTLCFVGSRIKRNTARGACGEGCVLLLTLYLRYGWSATMSTITA